MVRFTERSRLPTLDCCDRRYDAGGATNLKVQRSTGLGDEDIPTTLLERAEERSLKSGSLTVERHHEGVATSLMSGVDTGFKRSHWGWGLTGWQGRLRGTIQANSADLWFQPAHTSGAPAVIIVCCMALMHHLASCVIEISSRTSILNVTTVNICCCNWWLCVDSCGSQMEDSSMF